MTAADTPRTPATGAISRARASLAALETLDRLRESSEPASGADRERLLGWAGWGSLANAFEPRRTGVWAEIGERIEWLLPPEDQLQARKATYSAFYTPPEITRACWQILQGLGFDGGRILEPGCGAGVFMEHTPGEIRDDVRWLGVERDPTTAAIASALHPDAQIVTAPIQKARMPVASVDAVLGNVPFANTLIYDPTAPEPIRASLHNYCLWRSIQTLRPGGIAVLISSRYTLDAVDASARQALFAHADLLGAIRLPSTVWQAGGTTVTADILVLRRRRGEEDVRNHDRTWLDTHEVPELNNPVNRVFLTRPELVVGAMRAQHGHRYGHKLTVAFTATDALPTWQHGMARAVAALTAQQPDQQYRRWHVDAPVQMLSADNALVADAEGRQEGSFHIIDGRAMVVVDGQLAAVQTRRKLRLDSTAADPDITDGDDNDDTDGAGEEATSEATDDYDYRDLRGNQLAELRTLIELRDATVAVQAHELLAVEQERIVQRAEQRIAVALRQQNNARDATLAVLVALSIDQHGRLAQNPYLRTILSGLERATTTAQNARQVEQHAAAERDTAQQAIAAFDVELVGMRERLNRLYDDYQSRYGYLNRVKVSTGKPDEETGLPTITKRRPPIMQGALWASRAGAPPAVVRFRTDPNYFDLLALEDWDGDNQVGHKHTIFTTRVNKVAERVARADSAADAVALSLDTHNKLDIPTIAALLDITIDQVPKALGELAYLDPGTEEWTERGEYLSGNVRFKLGQAQAAAARDPQRFTRNVEALHARQPRDLGPGEIYGQLGAAWIPEEDVAQFIRELLNPRGQIVVKREALTSTWTILLANKSDRSRPEASHEWGTEAKDAYSLIEIELNGGAPEVRTTITENGKKTSAVDHDATAQAKARQKQIATRFSEWLWEDPDRADRLAESYNRTFNATVLRDYDGSHLTVPGMAADFVPYGSQRDMVFRAISNKTALCGHAVGGGKTTIMAMTAVKLRQLGLANKPMIVVLKATLEDIAREIRQRVPSAKILVADEASMSDWRSRTLWAKRCATGDYDAVIITHPAFTKISMHEQFQAEYLAELAASYRASLTAEMGSVDAEDNETGVSDRRVKQVEKLIADLEARTEYLLQHASDDNIHFEQLGVDYLLVDEFHYFKNLQVPCHTEGFSMSASKRASDLDMKLSWLRSQRDRVATFFSGTPVSNSMLELYVVLHYLMPERLDELGLSSPDAWARWCVQFEDNLEISPDGQTPRTKRRPTRFKNVYELLMLLNERADIRNKKQLGLVLPPTVRSTEVVPRSRVQEAYIAELAARAEAVKGKPPRKGADNILNIATDGRKCAIDPALVEVFDPSPVKYDTAIDQIVGTYRATKDLQFPADSKHQADSIIGQRGGFQLVFCDLGTPGDKGKKADQPAATSNRGQVYAKIRDGLIAEGIPRERIRFIHDAKSDQQRVNLFADCRNGTVSVLIASTEKGGVGVNVQDRLVRMHHVDAPWRPSDIEQREGRGERPGNRVRALADLITGMEARGEPVPENWPRAVEITTYVTEGSFDAFMWGKLEYKAEFIGQLLGGKLDPSLREIEDVGGVTMNYAEIKALSTGNELLMALAKAEQQFKALKDLAAAHTRTQKRLDSDTARYEKTVATNDTTVRTLSAIVDAIQSCVDDQRGFFTSGGDPIPADDLDEALANLANQALTARNNAKARRSAAEVQRGLEPIGKADDVLAWHSMGVTFEVRANGWRNETLHLLVRPHGLYSTVDLYRLELKLSYLNKGQHFRIRQALDDLLATCDAEVNALQAATLDLRDRIDAARRQVGKPFPQLAELEAARAEKDRINAELAAVKAAVDKGAGAPNATQEQARNNQILQLARVAFLNPASRRGLMELLTAASGSDAVVELPPRPRLLATLGKRAAESAAVSPTQVVTATEPTKSPVAIAPPDREPSATFTLPDQTALSETRAPDPGSRAWTGSHATGVQVLILAQATDPTSSESSRAWTYRLSRRSPDGLHLIGQPWQPDEQWNSHTELIEHLQPHLAAYTAARALLPVVITQARHELAALRAIPDQRHATTDSPVLALATGATIATSVDDAASYLTHTALAGTSEPVRWRGVDIHVETTPVHTTEAEQFTGPVCIVNGGYQIPLHPRGPSRVEQSIIHIIDEVISQAEHLAREHDAYLATLITLLDEPTRPLDALPNRPSLEPAPTPAPPGTRTASASSEITTASPGVPTRSPVTPIDSGPGDVATEVPSPTPVGNQDDESQQQHTDPNPVGALEAQVPAPSLKDHPDEALQSGLPGPEQGDSPEQPPPHLVASGPGPWSQRIRIDVTGTTATVSGTRHNDPPLLRNALKANGFQWKPKEGAVWKFTQQRRGTTRDEAIQAIQDAIAELDQKAAATSAPPIFPPTPQQQAIIDACLDGRAVAVSALAGTGKTSTLRMIAQRIPDKKIIYLAFNRAIADEAQAAFGPNVVADTMHAFAKQALLPGPYRHKLDNIADKDGFPDEIAAAFGMDAEGEISYGTRPEETIGVLDLIRMAQRAVKRFRESGDAELGSRHLASDPGQLHPGLADAALGCARRIWVDKTRPDGVLRFTHDDYLKIWALGNPRFPGDVIFFDEVQDSNELQAKLVQGQPGQVIVVGDSYQSIYGFRGAKDYLRTWPAEINLPLTQSWRFGPAVATTGNRFLRLLNSRLELEGNPTLDSVIGAVADPDAVLCRTNAAAVAAVIAGIEAGKRVALVGGARTITDIAKAARELQRGKRTKHPDLSMFTSWQNVREYVNQHDDAQSLRTFVRLVDIHGPDGLVAMANDLVDENETDPDFAAELVVSTAHKAKGREWNKVRIADDFKGPTEDPDTGATILPSAEDLRLAYVTVTRAKQRLDLGSLDWILTHANQRTAGTAQPVAAQAISELVQSQAVLPSESSIQDNRSEPAESDPTSVTAPADPGRDNSALPTLSSDTQPNPADDLDPHSDTIGHRDEVLETLTATDDAAQWSKLIDEIHNAGYQHLRQDTAGPGGVDHDARTLRTDSGWDFADELVALAGHVATLRERLNEHTADVIAHTVLDTAPAHGSDPLAGLRAVAAAGVRGTTARFVANRLHEVAVLRSIATVEAEHPNASIVSPSGAELTYDADFSRGSNHDRPPLVRGGLQIALINSPNGLEAAIEPAHDSVGAHWERLPSSTSTERTTIRDYLTEVIESAGRMADERYAQAAREIARALPAAPSTPMPSEPTPDDPHETELHTVDQQAVAADTSTVRPESHAGETADGTTKDADPHTPKGSAANSVATQANSGAATRPAVSAAGSDNVRTDKQHVPLIEHSHSGTVVHRTSKEDYELRNLLADNKFKYSTRQGFWYLGRQQRYSTRSFRVRNLIEALDRAGRAYELHDNEPLTTAEPPPAEIPTAEPFTTNHQVVAAARATWRAYLDSSRTPAGKQIINGWSNSRPDGRALGQAADEVLRHGHSGEPQALADRYLRLFQTASVLHTNLTAERKRAPQLMTNLGALVKLSRDIAARLIATIDAGNTHVLADDRTPAPERTGLPSTIDAGSEPEPQLGLFNTDQRPAAQPIPVPPSAEDAAGTHLGTANVETSETDSESRPVPASEEQRIDGDNSASHEPDDPEPDLDASTETQRNEELVRLATHGALSTRLDGLVVQTLRHALPVGWSTKVVTEAGVELCWGRDAGHDPNPAWERHRRYVLAGGDLQRRYADLVDRATALHADLLIADSPGYQPPEPGHRFTPLHQRAQFLLETANAGLVDRLNDVVRDPWVAVDWSCKRAVDTALTVLTQAEPMSPDDLATRILTTDEQPRNTAVRLSELVDLIDLYWTASPDVEPDQVSNCHRASGHLRAVVEHLVAATTDRASLLSARITGMLAVELDDGALEAAEHALAVNDPLGARERLAYSVSTHDPLKLVDPIARQALRALLFSTDDQLADLARDAHAGDRAQPAAETITALAEQLRRLAGADTRLGRVLDNIQSTEIADRLTRFAAVLVGDAHAAPVSIQPGAEPPPSALAVIDGAEHTTETTTEDADLPHASLSDQDIAHVLRHLLQSQMSEFVAWMRNPTTHRPPPNDQGFTGRRRGDPNAYEFVAVHAGRVEINVSTSTETRSGRPTWTTLGQWLRPGLDPADLCLLQAAHDAHYAFMINRHGFAAIGETGLADTAVRELRALRSTVTDRIINRALAAQLSGSAPRRRRSPRPDPLLRAAEPTELVGDHRSAWDRITALRAVLPDRTEERRPLTALVLGDVLLHPGYSGIPLRLTAITQADESFALTVQFVGSRWEPDEQTQTLSIPTTSREGNPASIDIVVVPDSLAQLIAEDQAPQPILASILSQIDGQADRSVSSENRLVEVQQRPTPTKAAGSPVSDEPDSASVIHVAEPGPTLPSALPSMSAGQPSRGETNPADTESTAPSPQITTGEDAARHLRTRHTSSEVGWEHLMPATEPGFFLQVAATSLTQVRDACRRLWPVARTQGFGLAAVLDSDTLDEAHGAGIVVHVPQSTAPDRDIAAVVDALRGYVTSAGPIPGTIPIGNALARSKTSPTHPVAPSTDPEGVAVAGANDHDDRGPITTLESTVSTQPGDDAQALAAWLLDRIDPAALQAADNALSEGTDRDTVLGPLWRGLPVSESRLDRPTLHIADDIIAGITEGREVNPDQRARREIALGHGVPTATALTALAAELDQRRQADDPLGLVLRRTPTEHVVAQLYTIADHMALHGEFTVAGRPEMRHQLTLDVFATTPAATAGTAATPPATRRGRRSTTEPPRSRPDNTRQLRSQPEPSPVDNVVSADNLNEISTPTPPMPRPPAAFGVTDDHPAVTLLRASLARLPEEPDPERAAANRHRMAAAVLDLFIATPQGAGVRTVLSGIASRQGHGIALLPRPVELRPAVEWPHWARTLRQCATVLTTAGDLDTFADRVNQVAEVIEGRIAELDDRPAAVIADVGMAALRLVPADHPATPGLRRQLERALRNQHVTGEHRDTRTNLRLARELLDAPGSGPEDIADREIARKSALDAGTVAELRTLAELTEAAGYTTPVPGRDASAPTLWRRLADALAAHRDGVPSRQPNVAHEVPDSVPVAPRNEGPEGNGGPVEQFLTALADGSDTAENTIASDLAANAIREATTRTLAAVREADADRVSSALEALRVGHRETALFQLSWAMPDNPSAIARGAGQAWELLDLVLGQASPAAADLLALSRYPITYYDDSPPHVAVYLLGIAAALRSCAESDDDLGRLLTALPIHPYADNLDTIAGHLAERHRFVLPPVPLDGSRVEAKLSAAALDLLRAVKDGHVARRYHPGTNSWDIRSTHMRRGGRAGGLGQKVTAAIERLERAGLVACDRTASEDAAVEPYQLTKRGHAALHLTATNAGDQPRTTTDPAAATEPVADAVTTDSLSTRPTRPASGHRDTSEASPAPTAPSTAPAPRTDDSDRSADGDPSAPQRDPGRLVDAAAEATPEPAPAHAVTEHPAAAPEIDPLPAPRPSASAVDSGPPAPGTLADPVERDESVTSPTPAANGLAPAVIAMRDRLAALGVRWPAALTAFLVTEDPFDAAAHLRTVSRDTDHEPHVQALVAMAWRAQHGQAPTDQVDRFTDRLLAGDPTLIAGGIGRQIRHPQSGQLLTISAVRADIEGRLLVRCGDPDDAATVTIALDPDAWLNPTAPEALPAEQALMLLTKWDQLTTLVHNHGYSLVEQPGTNTVEHQTRRVILGATTLTERVTRLAELVDVLGADTEPELTPTSTAGRRPGSVPTPPAPAGVIQYPVTPATAGRTPAQDSSDDTTGHTPDSRRASHEQINQEAMRWFYAQFAAAPSAQQYLQDRLGGQDIIDRIRATQAHPDGFLIGYAPPGWTGLVDHLRAQGFRDQDLVDAGVATVSRRDTLVDRFRARIIFGIRDADGRLAGFTGRALSDTDTPKYLNTPATLLFDKGSLLFGLYEQRALATSAELVFVEGPFDVAAIAAANSPDQPLLPVGVCGTALTDRHLAAVDALIPQDRRRIIAFDADGGGRPAMLARATDALPAYPHLDITTLPDGMDPASWAHTTTDDPNAAYHQPPSTRPALDVLVDARLDAWANRLDTAEGRIGAARDVAALLATVDEDRRNRIALDVAATLGLDPEQIASILAAALHEQRQRPGPTTAPSPAPRNDRDDPVRPAEREARPIPTASRNQAESTPTRPQPTTTPHQRRGTPPARREPTFPAREGQPAADDSAQQWTRLKRDASAAGYKVLPDYNRPSFLDLHGKVIYINGHRDAATRVAELRELLAAAVSAGAAPDHRAELAQPEPADWPDMPADASQAPTDRRVASVAALESPIPEWMDPPLFRSLMNELGWDDQPDLLDGVNSVPVAWIPAPRQPLPECLTPIYDQLAQEFWGQRDHRGDDITQQTTPPTPSPRPRPRATRNRPAGTNGLLRTGEVSVAATPLTTDRAGSAAVSSSFVHAGIAAMRGRAR